LCVEGAAGLSRHDCILPGWLGRRRLCGPRPSRLASAELELSRGGLIEECRHGNARGGHFWPAEVALEGAKDVFSSARRQTCDKTFSLLRPLGRAGRPVMMSRDDTYSERPAGRPRVRASIMATIWPWREWAPGLARMRAAHLRGAGRPAGPARVGSAGHDARTTKRSRPGKCLEASRHWAHAIVATNVWAQANETIKMCLPAHWCAQSNQADTGTGRLAAWPRGRRGHRTAAVDGVAGASVASGRPRARQDKLTPSSQ
jgi:hypothetical protein